ncbi:MAG: hypothetical protein LLG09_03695 [Negativicutes bacterium]|nr:hypothetical protein [Negativicutes bacterium]
MTKKSDQSHKNKNAAKHGTEIERSFFGLDSRVVMLALYLGSSIFFFLLKSPLVFAVFWLLSLLACQFSKDELVQLHALQAAAIHMIAFLFRLLINLISSFIISYITQSGGGELELAQPAQIMGWFSLALSLLVLAAQILASETAMRGLQLKLPVLYAFGKAMARFFLPGSAAGQE